MAERLQVDYLLTCAADESAEDKARGIALEQTVELPAACVPAPLGDRVVGRVERLSALPEQRYEATISFDADLVGSELTQLLNTLFGNISLQDGIRLTDIRWPAGLLDALGGPGHGMAGIREATGVPAGEALLCTALKPVGLGPAALAERAHRFALGGMDLIKDDHGIADQPSAPFRERLAACQEAVARANAETGGNSLYLPNVTAPWPALEARLAAARDAGCRGVLISPWITGLDAMRWARDRFGLVLMAHPALTGSYFRPEHGLSPDLLLGDLFRIAGADASIYPNSGGRFGFSLATCEAINHRLRYPLGTLRPAAPTPGGGVDAARAADWITRYGTDTILLIGGSLYAQGDLTRATASLREAIGRG
ncbi:RuBisCO large subunit C-terminal-like domain-containing protein [Aquisalimonas lutea]|uniref:RuBisCO large subunit C-terminal-like domain-containing protein n=1 Tax=Aquisalimonas lutea TaxID=1327750 RepID=UPI0025B29934|nr:RuBisCO large subunit C-terminal-like domain-containing protein [Aquisalimonas lutea]MDN3519208.1 RuBisCO large subunit C-terminal-like domain-containing protein [Aquisalimonas lutea]